METAATTPKMMHAHELPFGIPASLENDIEDYIQAYENDAPMFDMYLEILHQSANSLNNHDRAWLLEYYTNGGWERGLEYHDYA